MRHALIPTGHADVDRIMGGGFVRGGVSEVYGDEGAGKTSLVLSAVRQAQHCLYFDLDHSFPTYIARERQILDRITVIAGAKTTGEYEAILRQFDRGALDLIVFDPIAALGARQVFDLIPITVSAAKRCQAAVVVINHCDVQQQSTGHTSLSFYATQRLEMRFLKEGGAQTREGDGQVVGMTAALRCTKTTIAPARGRCELEIHF